MKNRFLSILLIICLLFSMAPITVSAGTVVPTEAQAYRSMIALKSQYPEGMRWTNDDYYAWNGYSPDTGVYYYAGYGCAAFAFLLSDAAFGKQPSHYINEVTIKNVRVGDILRINSDTHSVIVLERYSNYVVIAEGNYNSSIHWGRILSAAEVAAADYAITRYYEHVPASVCITTQPKSVTVDKGKTATVSLKATGDGLIYRWYYKNPGASDYTYTASFTGNSYSVPMSKNISGRRVLCRVYDKYGNVVQSNSVTLTMTPDPVRIATQPNSVTVARGKTATVSLKAIGDGLTYRWYYKNPGASSYTYTSAFKSNTYSVTMSDAVNGRRVLCRVYDKYGNVVQSNSVALKKTPETVRITTQPKNTTVARNETATVWVKATGDGLTYRWYYKNPGASSYTYTPTFKSNTYSVTMKDTLNGRRVLCRVYDKYGNVVQTNSVALNMTPDPVRLTGLKTSITNNKATVKVNAVGDGLIYRWYYKNPGASGYTYTSTFKSNTYSLNLTASNNGRRVICRVYDKYGNVVQSPTVELSR